LTHKALLHLFIYKLNV